MRVCQILVKQGCVDEASIEKALEIQVETKQEIGEILVEMGAIREADLSEALTFQSDLLAEKFSDKSRFLDQVEPFNTLTGQEVEEICREAEWRLYAPGEEILKQGEQVPALSVIKHGLAKVSVESETGESIVGFLGEGEFCGVGALLSDGVGAVSIEAVEPTFCLSLDRTLFSGILLLYPRFVGFFNDLVVRNTKKVLTRLLTSTTGTISQTEPFLYSKQVKDLISPNQIFCTSATTLAETARMLVDRKGHTAVVLDEAGRLAGTVGLKSLAEASLLKGAAPDSTVDRIMETDFHIIDESDFFFDALHEMMKGETDRLVVVGDERTKGVVTSTDLLKFRGREVLSLIRTIDMSGSFAELDGARRDVEQVLRTLMADGALASHACRIVSELNDRITGRAISLVEEQIGPAPAPYAWLGLGSEGRKEQTLLTDQDNALVFDEFLYARPVDGAEEYFRLFADRVVHGLNDCGFPLCKGNIMATNPRYFGNIAQWREKTVRWIRTDAAEGKDILDVYTFLDFRSVYGSAVLVQNLRAHVAEAMKENPVCLRALADPIVSVPMPLGFFKNVIVEKNGKYKNMVNIKTHGLLPLTTTVKLLAFHGDVRETNTLERLRGLAKIGMIEEDLAEEAEQAFETFLTLKIRNNLNSLDEGRDFSNNINPSVLTAKQKQLLKEAFLAVSRLQKATKDRLKVAGY